MKERKLGVRTVAVTFSLCMLLDAGCAMEVGPDEADPDADTSDLAGKANSGDGSGGQCAVVGEGGAGNLSCPSGQVIGSVTFASYGTPTGSCPSFSTSSCHASTSRSKVESLCLNKQSCSVGATNATFGDPCSGTVKKLAVVFTCKSVGSAGPCVQVGEGSAASLSCPSGQVIGSITFASYGTPGGSCPSFSTGSCNALTSKSKVESLCLNKQSCSVAANNSVFGDPCSGTPKKLGLTYTCKGGTNPPPPPSSAMPIFLLAGQSNMEGNTDRALHDGLMNDLASGTDQTQEQRVRDRLTSWYQNWSNGYAMYGYSAARVALESTELVRLRRAGLVGTSLSQPDSKVLCAWNAAPQPLTLNCGNPYGPELTLGRVLATTAYAPTALIKVAKGGTSLYVDWLPMSAARRTSKPVGPLYMKLLERIRSLRANPASVHPSCTNQACRWAGFVWFQGENDTFDAPYADGYEQNLRDMLADVRAEIGDSKLPVILIKIGAWAQSMTHGATVARAQEAVVSRDPYTRLVRTEDLSGFYHYDSAAQLIIGERVANALKAILSGQPPPPPPSGDQKCAEAAEAGSLAMSCADSLVIRSVTFASYGTPTGACPNFSLGGCHASSTKSKVESACLNKASCRVDSNNGVFGDPCPGTGKRLVVSYACGKSGG